MVLVLKVAALREGECLLRKDGAESDIATPTMVLQDMPSLQGMPTKGYIPCTVSRKPPMISKTFLSNSLMMSCNTKE